MDTIYLEELQRKQRGNNMHKTRDFFEPWIDEVSLVAPNILLLSVEEGFVKGGVQIPYIEQEGESLEQDPLIPSLVYIVKDGTRIGVKVEDQQLGTRRFPFETFCGEMLDTESADSVQSYQIDGKNPVRVYRKTKPNNIVDPYNHFTKLHKIYLVCKKPFKSGDEICLQFKTGLFHKESMIVPFVAEKLLSEAIHVSQVGFRKDDPAKRAYLSQWMGLGGGISYGETEKFFLVDKDSRCVYKGKVRLQHMGEPMRVGIDEVNSECPVYEMDFSDFSKEGIYRVVVPELGCSFPFQIGEQETWLAGFRANMNALYCHRSGIRTGMPYSRFERPRCFHPDDGKVIYQSECSLFESANGCNCYGTDHNNFGNLVRKGTDKVVKNAWGGYLDRRVQHLWASQMQIELYLMFPDFFNRVKLPIPESGNGLPDILNETLYNIDFYKRLQMEDGGICGGIEQEEHPILGQCGWQDAWKSYAYAPDFWSSYVYAAAAGRMAFALRNINRGLADEYEESAIRAFTYAEKTYYEAYRREGHKWTKRANKRVVLARELSACDLYRLTEDEFYGGIYVKLRTSKSYEASFVYCMLPNGLGDEKIKAVCRKEIIDAAERAVSFAKKMPYHLTTGETDTANAGPYDAFYTIPQNRELIRAHYMTGEDKYLAAAIDAAGFGAGANPDNLCYTTGIGKRFPQNILHHDSRMTGQDAPDGITVFGPHNFNRSDEVLGRILLEDPVWPGVYIWPSMEGYLDIYRDPALTEYTVMETIGPNCYQWGYFAAREKKLDFE